MIPIEMLYEKRKTYTEKLANIMSFDIDAEVNKRLVAYRDKIQQEVADEIHADAAKCRHYLEVIDELISSDVAPAEETPSEEVNTVESDMTYVDVNNNCEEANYDC